MAVPVKALKLHVAITATPQLPAELHLHSRPLTASTRLAPSEAVHAEAVADQYKYTPSNSANILLDDNIPTMTDNRILLSEEYVQNCFHSYLKSALTQAKAERLLDTEVLSSAEGDLMITGEYCPSPTRAYT